MSNKTKKPDRQDRAAADNPALQQLRRRLTEPGPWPQRFRRLAEAIVQVADLSCEDCVELLDLFVDEALRGTDVAQTYPLVSQHLETCPGCRQAHDMLFETLTLDRRDALPAIPCRTAPRPRVSQPHPTDTPWTIRLRPRIGGAPFGLSVTFRPAYLHNLLVSPAPLPTTRDDPRSLPRTLLLLSDSVPMGDVALSVLVIANRDPQASDRLRLQATIASPAALPENLWATLTWAGQTQAGPVDDQGQADLGEVSLAVLQDALDTGEGVFEITFETRP